MAENGKLLYHLTALENLESILQNGLKTRASLSSNNFKDIADDKIIDSRHQHGLEQYVPFHSFAKNPFDYGVQRANPSLRFILITVRRELAKREDWKIVPCHPLAQEGYTLCDYDDGINKINWSLINQRDYSDRECKLACMAECLSPRKVPTNRIFSIFTKTIADKETVASLVKGNQLNCHINLLENMFVGDANV